MDDSSGFSLLVARWLRIGQSRLRGSQPTSESDATSIIVTAVM